MKPRRFDYVRPDSVEGAVAVLAEYGEQANVLAGGQSLMAMLNLRLAEPAILVDIARIAELDYIRRAAPHADWAEPRAQIDLSEADIDAAAVEVGAAVTQNRLMAWSELADTLPLVAAALPYVGHFQTRNRGTVCGSIAHADPSSELPLALATLGGSVVLRSRRGTRVLAAAEFQRGMLATAREPDELIVAVRFPVQTRRRAVFREIARRHGDFAIIAVAALAESANSVRVGIGGVADRPAVRRIEIDGVGSGAPAAAAAATFESLAAELEGYDDMHATAAMRRDLLRRLGPVVVDEALRCAA